MFMHMSAIVESLPVEVRAAYDFTNAVYTGSTTPITGIVCPIHGEFKQYVGQLRKKGGAGCPQCGAVRRAKSRALSTSALISRASEIHPRLLFPKTVYTNMKTKVLVTCPLHGDFEISPIKLVHAEQGCPTCGGLLRGRQKDMTTCRLRSAESKRDTFRGLFEQRARKVHGDLYDYSEHGYTSGRGKVKIFCRKHGPFEQAVYHHLRGQGCPNCGQKSAPENEIATMLSLFTTVAQRNRTLLAPREIDIFLPEKSLAVEYCGEYWHSHGDEEHEAKHSMNHFRKYQDCKAHGVRLLTIFESEWKNHNYAIRRLLRNAAGSSRGKLMARKCELRMVEHRDAVAFYDRYHPQGGAGNGTHYGLYWKDKLVACMRFTEGANDRGNNKKREWTLTRFATRITVSGGASRLFSAFLKDKNPKTVKSFSDNRYFDGGMYAKLRFELVEEAKPDYMVWHPKLGLLPKSAWQRRSIPQRAKEIGHEIDFDPETDPRTERDMTFLLGGRRIYDCGKKRWVWTRPTT